MTPKQYLKACKPYLTNDGSTNDKVIPTKVFIKLGDAWRSFTSAQRAMCLKQLHKG